MLRDGDSDDHACNHQSAICRQLKLRRTTDHSAQIARTGCGSLLSQTKAALAVPQLTEVGELRQFANDKHAALPAAAL